MTEQLSKHYSASFYQSFVDGSRLSAEVVVPIVNRLVKPQSVLDVGCGLGTWLAEWITQGVGDVLGVDGEHVDGGSLQVEATHFQTADLQSPLNLGRRFDLVESLEVAEHLDESRADEFVRSLTRHADTILFSAAIPGQRGFHHVNEQWPSYWISRFSREGYDVYDAIRPVIWSDSRVDTWYRQNIFIFSKATSFDTRGGLTDIVHPEMWQDRLRPGSLSLRDLARHFPAAAHSSIRSFGGKAAAKLSR
jgi:SAM-dependent methyltransferase